MNELEQALSEYMQSIEFPLVEAESIQLSFKGYLLHYDSEQAYQFAHGKSFTDIKQNLRDTYPLDRKIDDLLGRAKRLGLPNLDSLRSVYGSLRGVRQTLSTLSGFIKSAAENEDKNEAIGSIRGLVGIDLKKANQNFEQARDRFIASSSSAHS